MSYSQIMGLGAGEGGAQSVNVPVLNKGSRAEFLAFMQTSEINDEIKSLVKAGKLKLADAQYYATKMVTGKTTRLFEPQDSKEVGIGNIDRARLPKHTVFLVTGMQILAAQPTMWADNWRKASKNDCRLQRLPARAPGHGDDFQPFSGLETGELTLRANRQDLITDFPLSAFKEDKNSVYPPGFVKLDNPRLIKDDTEIELDVELGEEVLGDYPPDEAVWLRVIMHGTATIPA